MSASVYEMELGWAVNTQIDILGKVLKEYPDYPEVRPVLIRTSISSAPHNESLFDSLTLFVKVDEDGTSHLRGIIREFHLPNDLEYKYEVKSFASLKELKEWYFHSGECREICKKVLLGASNMN